MRTDRTSKENTKFEERVKKEVNEKFRVNIQVRVDIGIEGDYIGALWFLDDKVKDEEKEQVIKHIKKKFAKYLDLKDDEFYTEVVVTPDDIERIDFIKL